MNSTKPAAQRVSQYYNEVFLLHLVFLAEPVGLASLLCPDPVGAYFRTTRMDETEIVTTYKPDVKLGILLASH